MSFGGAFTSLRLNRRDSQGQGGFWPSFTGIMAIIIMIFLIALVTLLIRNVGLVKQLRSTLASERVAAEIARATGEEKETLALKLNEAESEISMMRLQLMRLEEERDRQEATIASQASQISGQTEQIHTLTQEREELQLQTRQLGTEAARLREDLQAATADLAGLRKSEARLSRDGERLRKELAGSRSAHDAIRQKYEELQQSHEEVAQQLAESQKQHQAVQRELAGLRRDYDAQARELLKYRSEAHQLGRDLSALQSEYDRLNDKYEKLVSPARSPVGKIVISIRYYKVKNKYRIEFKGPGAADFEPVNRAELNARLDKLKMRHPKGLYIKVILPEDSGLSYNEGWAFTKDLHRRYDYYFQ
ncbi:MAG TPA: hypothetical protein ENI99_04130 [Sedimenticola sp.]|nr:hypothetical protein [Sedimenticola sp.]